MGKPTVIIIGADKGGVGKTTVARTLLDYLGKHKVPTRKHPKVRYSDFILM
jgi:cellulose biosynthesis protein BcsQ